MICSETPISKACETTYPVEQWKILCNSGMWIAKSCMGWTEIKVSMFQCCCFNAAF
jgi:hypothetical protein